MGHPTPPAVAMQYRDQFYFLRVNGAYKNVRLWGNAKRTPLGRGVGEQNVPLTWRDVGGGICIVYPGGQ